MSANSGHRTLPLAAANGRFEPNVKMLRSLPMAAFPFDEEEALESGGVIVCGADVIILPFPSFIIIHRDV